MKLAENIYFYEGSPAISKKNTQPLYRGMGSSNFLVLTGTTQVMIDSGFNVGPDQRRIKREMTADGIDIAKTSCVVFSHAHPDHFQQAKYLAKQQQLHFAMHRDNELFVRSEEFQFAAYYNYPAPIKREIMFLPKPLASLALKLLGFGFDYLTADYLFENDAILDWGKGIRAVGMPGHCKGHVGFHFPDRQLFYAADLLFESGSAYPILPCVTNALSSMTQGLADIELVSQLEIDVLIPGHGKPLFGAPSIQNALKAAHANAYHLMEDIVACLRHKRQTLTELTRTIFHRSHHGQYAFNIAIVYQALLHLRSNQLLSSSAAGQQILWHLI